MEITNDPLMMARLYLDAAREILEGVPCCETVAPHIMTAIDRLDDEMAIRDAALDGIMSDALAEVPPETITIPPTPQS